MGTSAVNGIPAVVSDLFFQCPEQDQYIVLCARRSGTNYTILAHKGPGAWQSIEPIQATQQELFAATDAAQFAMTVYPQVKAGFVYLFFCRYTCALSAVEQTALINEIADKHDRVFVLSNRAGGVEPQTAVVALLRGIPDNIHNISIFYTINFAERKYTMTGVRYLGHTPIQIGTDLDPLGFDTALRAFNWRMIAPPVYNAQNTYTAYARGTNNNYTATIERSTEGERFMLDSETDRQNRKKRRAGMDANFTRSISHRNTGTK